MKFYVVYKILDYVGSAGHKYFLSEEKARKYYEEWQEEEEWEYIVFDVCETED